MIPRGRRLHHYTYSDYVAIEMDSETKHEFLDGEIYAMSGGSAEHAALAARVISALDMGIGAGPCVVYTSDLRIHVEAVGLSTFPDGSIVCGDVEQHAPSPTSTALNPTVLLEVTSPATEQYDSSDKLDLYKHIPSLKEVILVSHRERRITVHRRVDGDHWTSRVGLANGRVRVESVGVELVVDEIYRKTSIR